MAMRAGQICPALLLWLVVCLVSGFVSGCGQETMSAAKQQAELDRLAENLDQHQMIVRNREQTEAGWQKLVDLGNAEAAYLLGRWLYLDDDGTQSDRAVRLLLRAYRADYFNALFLLYHNDPELTSAALGRPVQEELTAAAERMAKLAEDGDIPAILELAFWIEMDTLPQQDRSPLDLYRQAAELGSVESMVFLADGLLEADEPDFETAKRWLTKAAECGSEDAAKLLADYDRLIELYQ
ncbi:MAG: hypothetical protein NXI04_26970 [Planctomycetaceae bacterium]|nr:hypothetical protein [Planctomycetaceae bacterium]